MNCDMCGRLFPGKGRLTKGICEDCAQARREAANLAKAFSVDTDPNEPARGTVGYVFARIDALVDWNEGRARLFGDRYRRASTEAGRESAMVAEAAHWRAAGDLRFVRETLDDALRH